MSSLITSQAALKWKSAAGKKVSPPTNDIPFETQASETDPTQSNSQDNVDSIWHPQLPSEIQKPTRHRRQVIFW